MKECRVCGEACEESAVFCHNCGARFEVEAMENQPVPSEKVSGFLCENCQEPLEEGAKFCVNCGASIEAEVKLEETAIRPDIQVERMRIPATVQRQRQPMPLLTKVLIGLAAFLVIVGGGTYLYGKQYYSKEKQVQRFVEILKTKDANKLAEVLKSGDPNYQVTATSLEPYLDYYASNSHKEAFSNLITDLETQGDTLADLSLKKEGNFYFLFDKYQYYLKPVYIRLTTNQEGVEFSVNQEILGKSDSEAFSLNVGPLTPGDYTIVGELAKDNETQTNQVNLMRYGNPEFEENQQVSVTINKVSFLVMANAATGDVLVDGKKIGELKDSQFEVKDLIWHKGMTVQVLRSFPDKTELKSNSQTIGEGEFSSADYNRQNYTSRIELSFDHLKDQSDAQFLLDNLYANLTTDTNTSYSYGASELAKLASYFENGKSNPEYVDFDGFISEIRKSQGKSYVAANGSLESLELIGKNTYRGTYLIEYRTVYSDYKKDSLTQVFRYKQATFIYDEADGQMKIRDLGGAENFEQVS